MSVSKSNTYVLFARGSVEDDAKKKHYYGEGNKGGYRFHGYDFPILSICLAICRYMRMRPIPSNTTPVIATEKVRGGALSPAETSQPANALEIAIAAPSQSL